MNARPTAGRPARATVALAVPGCAAAPPRRLAAAAGVAAVLLTAGCASVPPSAAAEPSAAPAARVATPGDPWERWNRRVFAFNDALDRALVAPLARTYQRVLPQPVRSGVGNVLGNIGDVWSAANHVLQGKVQTGLETGLRVLTNTTFGLGGLLDPATEMGLVRRSEDFGQTLAVWGVGGGPYLVLPLLGPSNIRDGVGFLVDRQTDASSLPSAQADRYAVLALEVVHTRAELLATTALLSDVALDRYSFVRDGWLARRQDQIFDGAPPMDGFQDEPPSDAAPPAAPSSAPAPAPVPRPGAALPVNPAPAAASK